MDRAAAANIFVNRYSGVPRGKDYEIWREETCRRFCGLDIQPSQGDSIDCRVQISLLGNVAFAIPDGASAQFARTREVLSDGCDDVVLVIAKAGRVLVTQKGQPIELAESQMCLADMSVLGAVGHSEQSRFRTVRIPRAQLLAVSPKAEDRLFQVLGENAALRETIAQYHTLAANMAPRLDAVGQHLMAQHIIDMTSLLLGGGDSHLIGAEGHAAARFDLMRAEVLANLSQRSLNIESVARKHGLSRRQAQRLFERAETTFTDFLLEQRLLLAHKLLLDTRNQHRKISDIAHSAGFSDLSYFNRAFRARFGVTPSESRGDRPLP
jgi:AraC-like DNA-binding protein